YGSFAGGNLGNFHAIDGSGYKFIKNKIVEIDSFNSHISSALAGAFQSFAYVDDNQAKLMKIELEDILTNKNITPGLYEIVSKTLKARK
ncbi:MAG: aminopeptidase N C-terminal domain-containing protein, partial [Spirochaetales bacterium]|nr:aminopeptidase N C-terminal domain-containing protein [Spirochaetales bacterium]